MAVGLARPGLDGSQSSILVPLLFKSISGIHELAVCRVRKHDQPFFVVRFKVTLGEDRMNMRIQRVDLVVVRLLFREDSSPNRISG